MRQGTIGDLAAELGISTQRIEKIRATYPNAPKPVRTATAGKMYDLDKWAKWAKRHRLGKHQDTA